MSSMLQEILPQFGCNILNYKNNRIEVDHFFSVERYLDFKKGVNCRQGMGLFNENEELNFNKLKDDILIVVLHNDIQIAKYQFNTIYKNTIVYKDKKSTKSLTFSIRKNKYHSNLIYIDSKGISLDFNSLDDINKYLKETYDVENVLNRGVVYG